MLAHFAALFRTLARSLIFARETKDARKTARHPTFLPEEPSADEDVSEDGFDPQRSDEEREEEVEMREQFADGSFYLVLQCFSVHLRQPDAGPSEEGAEKSSSQGEKHLKCHFGDV